MPPVKCHHRDLQWTEEIYAQFVELLPAVLKHLKQVGKLNAKFMEMIAYDRFPILHTYYFLIL